MGLASWRKLSIAAVALMTAATRKARWTVEWQSVAETLRAFEPSAAELVRAAPTLAAFYNDRYNRAMMSNTVAS